MAYKTFGMLIIILFCGCYMLKSISQKKRGIETMQLGKGKTGFPKVIEILLKIFSILAFAAEIISIIAINKTNTGIHCVPGLIIASIGTILFIKSVTDMKENWRAGTSEQEKTELVTNGIYGWSRNPAFLGFDLCYIGLLITFFNWPLFFVVLITVLLFHLQIVNVEEDFLLKQFGDAYLEYRNSVNRYFGRKKA